MSEYDFTVSLRIRHPRMDPAVITATLGMTPQHTWRAGDPRCDPAGTAVGGQHRESYWMASLMDEPQLSSDEMSVERVLLRTLTQLRRAQDFLEQLSTAGGAAELHVSLYAREVVRLELSADSLAWLGRLGLAIGIEVHAHAPVNAPGSKAN